VSFFKPGGADFLRFVF
jgi:hypothetical protein